MWGGVGTGSAWGRESGARAASYGPTVDELVRDGRERVREGEMTKYDKINKFRIFFANVRHRGTTWHATSASDACVVGLGPLVKHLMYFSDPDVRFESLGT